MLSRCAHKLFYPAFSFSGTPDLLLLRPKYKMFLRFSFVFGDLFAFNLNLYCFKYRQQRFWRERGLFAQGNMLVKDFIIRTFQNMRLEHEIVSDSSRVLFPINELVKKIDLHSQIVSNFSVCGKKDPSHFIHFPNTLI